MADGSFAGNGQFDDTSRTLVPEFLKPTQRVKGLKTAWNDAYEALRVWVRDDVQPNKAYLELFIDQELVNEDQTGPSDAAREHFAEQNALESTGPEDFTP